jgi:transposase-like protein
VSDVTPETPEVDVMDMTGEAQRELVGALVERARGGGLEMVGQGGMLTGLIKMFLEAALQAEMDDHLGYGKHDPAGVNSGNSRNGSRSKTVTTEVGPVEIEVPRDRDASFEPQIVRKRQRRLNGVEEMVLSLSARGMTHGDISAHLAEVYGATVSKQTISVITERVEDAMSEWQNRPLDAVYPVLFIDAIHVKIRDGKVANRPIYVVMAVTVDGCRDILGLWAGDGGEGAKFWHQVLTEVRNRGVGDCCMVVCDGLKGLPESINSVWPRAIVQTCVIHLLRNTYRYAPRQHWEAIARDLRPVYTAATESAAMERWLEFAETWGARFPAIVRLWENAWAEFVPFLAFDTEIRKVICSTNAIESVNSRIRKAVRARGHFPNEQAALKCVYMAVMSLDPTGNGMRQWVKRWKAALNAFEIQFEGRLTTPRK